MTTTTMRRPTRALGGGIDILAFTPAGTWELTIIERGEPRHIFDRRVRAAQAFARRTPEPPRTLDPRDRAGYYRRQEVRFTRAGWTRHR